MTTHVPGGTSDNAVDDMRRREECPRGELATRGNLLRLWRPPLASSRANVARSDCSPRTMATSLAEQGRLVRLWVLPGEGSALLGLWRAHNGLEMQAILDSLPLDDWLTTVTTPLDPHPSDPALVATYAVRRDGCSLRTPQTGSITMS